MEVRGAQVTLDLPPTFGKAHRKVNIRRLKFFEERDARLGSSEMPPQPLIGVGGAEHYEIQRICNSRCLNGRHEMLVEWEGYDQSHNSWVHRDMLLEDVPAMVAVFDANPSNFRPRSSAPKRATTGRHASVPNPRRSRVLVGVGGVPGVVPPIAPVPLAPRRAGLRPR